MDGRGDLGDLCDSSDQWQHCRTEGHGELVGPSSGDHPGRTDVLGNDVGHHRHVSGHARDGSLENIVAAHRFDQADRESDGGTIRRRCFSMSFAAPDDRPAMGSAGRLSHVDLLATLVLLQVSQSFLSADSILQRALFNVLFLVVVVSAIRTLSKSRIRMMTAVNTGVMGYALSDSSIPDEITVLAYLGRSQHSNSFHSVYTATQPSSTKTTEHGTMRIVKPTTFNRLLILGWISTVIGCNSAKNDYDPPPPPEVTVAQPVQQSITPFLEQNGVIEAVDEAEVRARVRGFVQSVNFEPGQEVAAGDVIYQIEPDQYQAAVNSAKATVASSEAAIAVANALVKTAEAETKRAEQNLAREKSLMQQSAGSQADLDAAVAANDGAAAALESAKANVEAAIATKGSSVASLAQAQLDLDYTTVKSPISGRISTTDVKQGNLVENGAKLATVVNRNQVFANFSVSDREMLRFMRANTSGVETGREAHRHRLE